MKKKAHKDLSEFFKTLSFDEKLDFLFQGGKLRVSSLPNPADPAKGMEEAIKLSEEFMGLHKFSSGRKCPAPGKTKIKRDR